MHGKIKYIVRIHVFRRGAIIGYAEKTLRIYNDMDIQPPTCMVDFPSEYRWKLTKPSRGYCHGTGISFSACATEPAPFLFCDAEDTALTMLPITLGLNLPYEVKSQYPLKLLSETIEARITWRLKSLTFLSVCPLTSMPTIAQSTTQSSVSMMTANSQRHRLDWTLAPWESPSTSKMKSPDGIWTQTVELPLLLSKLTLPTPPIFTPFLSRRYHLSIKLKLVSRSSGKSSIELELPVQIAYQQYQKTNSNARLSPAYRDKDESSPQREDPADEVPIYCR